jgi:large subunit ribosomal protein L12
MEMIYAALLLHSTGKKIDEEHIKKVIEAAGEKADPAMVKALVSSLKDVNIDEAIKQSAFMPVAAAPEAKEVKAEKKEEKKEDESKKAEEAAAGLSSLFG